MVMAASAVQPDIIGPDLADVTDQILAKICYRTLSPLCHPERIKYTTMVLTDIKTASIAGGTGIPQSPRSENTDRQGNHNDVIAGAPPDILHLFAIAGGA